MEAKLNFDREKILNWFNEDCKIDCKDCPLEGYMCNILLRAAHIEDIKKIFKGDK